MFRIPICGHYKTTARKARDAILRVVEKHQTLRSSFHEESGRLQVSINSSSTFDVRIEKVAIGSSTEVSARIRELLVAPLPIDGTWLIRAKIFDLGDGRAAPIVVANHLVCDAPSRALILAEIRKELCADGAELVRPAIATSDVTFFDYVEWENACVNSSTGAARIDYWTAWCKKQILLKTPGTRQTLSWRPGDRIAYRFQIGTGILRRSAFIARSYRTTPFFLYLTCLARALAHWSGRSIFAVRSITNSRSTKCLSSCIGLITHANMITVHVGKTSSFIDVLRNVESEYHSAFRCQLPNYFWLPPHPDRSDGEQFPIANVASASINFASSAKTFAADTRANSDMLTDWPPILDDITVEHWSIPVSPIFLQLADQDELMRGVFQFNDALLTRDEQSSIMNAFFAEVDQLISSHDLVPAVY